MKSLFFVLKTLAVGFFAVLLVFAVARAWWLRPKVWLEPISAGHAFDSPVDLTTFPSEPDKLIVTQKYGKIYWFDKKDPKPNLMLDISDRVYAGGEEGLLSIAIDPQNPNTAYIYYCLEKPFRNRLSRVQMREGRTLDISTEEILITFEKPKTGHNAGDLQFGSDGYLWASFGEAGMYSRKMLDKLEGSVLGTIIRIDVRKRDPGKLYSIPADNPKFNDPRVPPEVFAKGFRNPWRWNFIDDKTLIVGDVGRNDWEELNISKGGEHFGWPIMEGFDCVPPEKSVECSEEGLTRPMIAFSHEVLRSVIGGVIYKGTKIPWLQGQLIFADYLRGVMSVPFDKRGIVTKKWDFDLTFLHPKLPMKFGPNKGRTILPVDFFLGADNEVYITAISGGVYQMRPISFWQSLRGFLYMLTSFR